MLKSESHTELPMPLTGPGVAGPASHQILLQKSWPLPSGKDGPTPHHGLVPHLGSTLELKL